MPHQTDHSFSVIARQQLPWLYSLARRVAGNRAEDVVQDCLIRAYKAYGSLEDVQAAPALVPSDPDQLRPRHASQGEAAC